ncbi:unnamed protein product [Somion occarium]|uniref:non-specific serine/threonine protein kinase n=1 Tax=Somion occarium TaxID=3059160 RepID=A0ABP1DFC6_9APHY
MFSLRAANMQGIVSRCKSVLFSSSTQAYKGLHFKPNVGAVYHSRYQFLRQLGSGQHSTVWLVKDVTKSGNLLAIKVLTDEVTSYQGKHAFELDILKNIQAHAKSSTHAGIHHLLTLQDYFYERGDEGEHLFLVTDVLDRTLLQVQQSANSRKLPMPLVKSITRQLLLALDFLHDVCQVVHTELETNENENTAEIPDATRRVKLTDYGTAMPSYTKRERLIQPEALRAPEVLLGCTWGPSADIWNLGCLIFELLTGGCLFRPSDGPNYTASQQHLASIFAIVGLGQDVTRQRFLPFAKKGSHYRTYFNEADGIRLAFEAPEPLQRVLEVYHIKDDMLHDLLSSMLRIIPDDRKSAKELLSHPWLL